MKLRQTVFSKAVSDLPYSRATNVGSTRSFLWVSCWLLVATGCSTGPYPDDWAPLPGVVEPRCADLKGSYENYGVQDDGARITLASVLFRDKGTSESLRFYEQLAVSHLSFDHLEDGGFVVSAWVGEELLMKRSLSPAQLPCEEGNLTYRDEEWYLGGVAPFLPVAGRSSIARSLSRASDGSMVVENREISVGAAVVVPLAVKRRYWYRFLQTAADPSHRYDNEDRPRGVRATAKPAYRLLPPEDAEKWSGYGIASGCLSRVTKSGKPAEGKALSALGGRSTQSFLLGNRDGSIWVSGTVVGSNWIPVTHDLRIEKQHWHPPWVSDHYVLCLLEKGYVWEEV